MTSQLDNGQTLGTVRSVNDQDPHWKDRIGTVPFGELTTYEQDQLYVRLRALWQWREECGCTRRLFVANLNGRGVAVTYSAWCRAEREWQYGIRVMHDHWPGIWEVGKSLLYRHTAKDGDPD